MAVDGPTRQEGFHGEELQLQVERGREDGEATRPRTAPQGRGSQGQSAFRGARVAQGQSPWWEEALGG